MPSLPSEPIVWLNREALRSNVKRALEICGSSRLMLAVKSNAYGLGAELVVPEVVAAGAHELAVLDIETGLAIRPMAPETPLLAWLLAPDSDFAAALEATIELGISALWQLDAIEACRSSHKATIHLKIDTGLHRNGALLEDWPNLVARAAQLESAGVVRVRAVWSHLADTSDETTLESLGRLEEAADLVRQAGIQPEILHLAASHAAIELPQTRLDMVRLGILAYGISPFSDRFADDLGFAPVMTLTAPVVHHSDVIRLGVGYGHGVIAPVGSGIEVDLHGGRYRVREVGVDQIELEHLSGPKLPEVGEHVALLGGAEGAIPAEKWAALAHTIGDEVVAHLDPSLERRWA